MNQNDYVILFDENGQPYIAHAGWLDNAKNVITNAAQQVANKAKGVGRGVRQNHKYILKVFENGKTRYFYKQEEVKAYYEAKKRGIKNAAEYAQNAASKAGNAAKSAFREATGQAARERMDEAANRRDTEAANMQANKQNLEISRSNAQSARQATREAEAERNRSEAALKGLKDKWKSDNEKALDVSSKAVDALTRKYAAKSKALKAAIDSDLSRPWEFQKRKDAKTIQANAWQEAQQAEKERTALHDEYDRINKSRELTKKAYSTELAKSNEAWNKRAQALRDQDTAEKSYRVAQDKFNELRAAYREADSDYNKNKAAYDKSLAGAVDRTAARAKETASSAFSKAKDAANNTISNAKNAYERMKGEFRDRAEQAGNAVKSTAKNAVDKAKDIAGYDEKERFDKAAENKQNTKDAARKGEQYVTDVLNESNPLHRTQTEAQRLNAAVGIRNERWNAEDKARAEYLRARDAYNKTPLAMINRAKEAISSATDSVRDATKDTAEAVARVPKAVKNAVKNAAEDVAFNAQYYSKQLKEGITGEKATKMASDIREEARIWKNRADDTKDKDLRNFYEQQYQKAEDFAKRFDAQAAKSLNGRANSAVNSVKGMIDNARSSTAKAVNEAWDKIPKNADGTVNPFDKNFQSTYNDWKAKKDKYDSSLAGRAKDTAEKATDAVQDMIDQARKAISNEPPKPVLSSPNKPLEIENIETENIIKENRVPERRITEQRIEESRIPERIESTKQTAEEQRSNDKRDAQRLSTSAELKGGEYVSLIDKYKQRYGEDYQKYLSKDEASRLQKARDNYQTAVEDANRAWDEFDKKWSKNK